MGFAFLHVYLCSKWTVTIIEQVTVAEARENCQRVWMKDALDKLVKKLETTCSISRIGYLLDVAVSCGSLWFNPCHRCPSNGTNLPNYYHLRQ